MLAWYDRHGRKLPWRAERGVRPDPYAVWLSEVMLQQTTTTAVRGYYARFLALWPDVAALAAAPREEVLKQWAGLGYYARARNLHDCAATLVQRHGGRFPDTEAALRDLPGIGDYTAAAIASIAFGLKAAVVDGNVERVVSRLFALETPMPAARPLVRRLTADLVPEARPGDFAQAAMDLGATLCTPKTPACGICPVNTFCLARSAGDPSRYPRRAPRKDRPPRFGAVAVVRRSDGAVLVRTRPAKGLLGGMTEFFGSDWGPAAPDPRAFGISSGAALTHMGRIEHAFTHFALTLEVYAGASVEGYTPDGFRWVSVEQFAREPVPTAFRKVWDAANRAKSALVAFDPGRLSLVGLDGADQQRRRKSANREA